MSFKCELEVMKCIWYLFLVNFKVWSIELLWVIFVFSYYFGGDFFDVVSKYWDLFSFLFLSCMFVELIGVVSYFYGKKIVYRDIKFESECFFLFLYFCIF